MLDIDALENCSGNRLRSEKIDLERIDGANEFDCLL